MDLELVMDLELIRVTAKGGAATRGVLLINKEPVCCTLELPWRANEFRVSCIPDGSYQIVKTIARMTNGGMHIPETFEVQDVPNRTGILFHIGNTVADSNGCILLGESFGYIDGMPAITRSKGGFATFLSLTKDIAKASMVIRWS